ncbi:UBiquitin Conjugating enzyme family member [Echinococcus multilocularis]|uniref:UBiquitin Conjugating enzyme family member n=1 Tax=Echinococcus multilocularis TaxID=6211 RepID=A0A068XVQ1_ECHMU|nr:UBiquitin Conjugating enzyme family member [Echinococcus multilocularis]
MRSISQPGKSKCQCGLASRYLEVALLLSTIWWKPCGSIVPVNKIIMTCPTTQRTFMKDVQHLYRTIDASTNGQASIIAADEMTVKVSLRPTSGYNAHAEFLLTIKCCSTYPKDSPDISFDTPIFHPNIDPSSGPICLSLLYDWRSCYNLLDMVKAVLYVIDHPAFDSPNNDFGIVNDPAQLPTMTARVLAGLPVKGRCFPPNTAWVKWARDNGCLPTGEEELEEAGAAIRTGDEVDLKGGEEIDAPVNASALENKVPFSETIYAPSDGTSDTVPSFAKMRYLFDLEEKITSWGPYDRHCTPFEVESQRVLIWHPSNGRNKDNHTVFYFFEFLGTDHHRNELGEHYNTLFVGTVLREYQSHPESRQTSSSCPCNMFEVKEAVRHTLTEDFCPWSALDGRGINALFSGLYFESNRLRGNVPYFLDEGSGDGSGNQDIERLFNSCHSDHGDVFAVPTELSDTELFESDAQSKMSDLVVNLIPESEVSAMEERDNSANESDKECKEPSSSVSFSNCKDGHMSYPLITDCTDCRSDYNRIRKSINVGLAPVWKWFSRSTRWSIRFAPQQIVDLSMTGIKIPPWRASSGRMMSDICRFCAKNQDITNLVLLDPTALSPLSPLLNLMRYRELPSPRLTGVLWMTPLNALSPFYRVPIPVKEELQESEFDGCEERDGAYPTPICLRFLAVISLAINWMAWLSRMENYAALGMSRFHPALISAPVAACLLQPFSLGCGQAPLMDLWPLWSLRRLLTLSLRLSRLPSAHGHGSHHHLRYLFPFSDLDEI